MSTPARPQLLGDVKSQRRGTPSTFVRVYLTLWALTLGSAVVLGFAPFDALAELWVQDRLQLEPHAVPSPGTAVATFVHNAAAAGWPLLFVLLRFHRDALLQDFGTALLGAFIVINTGVVGAASAVGGEDLVPYLVHLPIEWAAVAVAAASWLVACRRALSNRQLAGASAVFLILVAVAAFLETYAVPHL